ncbi:LOW QUALITY PROTEIN: hypothetical protein TorRG33x02_305240, partial [Trema orientale]
TFIILISLYTVSSLILTSQQLQKYRKYTVCIDTLLRIAPKTITHIYVYSRKHKNPSRLTSPNSENAFVKRLSDVDWGNPASISIARKLQTHHFFYSFCSFT